MKNPILPGLNIPVRTIFCIGRNYAAHAHEMKAAVPEQPMVFLKPLSSLHFAEEEVKLPPQSNDVHFEGEIVLAVGSELRNANAEEALQAIAGIGLGIDFTARDLQQQAKDKGHPWSVAKGFEGFAPVSSFLKTEEIGDLQALEIRLFQNNELKQQGNTKDLLFPFQDLLSYLSEIVTLYPGDLIFTGTPAGVGPVSPGDHLRLSLNDDLLTLDVKIA